MQQVSNSARTLLTDAGLLDPQPRPPVLPAINTTKGARRKRNAQGAGGSTRRKLGPVAHGGGGRLKTRSRAAPPAATTTTTTGEEFATRFAAMEKMGRGYRCGQSWVPDAYGVSGRDPIVQHERKKTGSTYDYDAGGWVYKKYPPETPQGDRTELLWLAGTLDAVVAERELSLGSIRESLNAAADGSLDESDAHRALDKLAERFALLDLGLHELHRITTVQNANVGYFMNELRKETVSLFKLLLDTACNAALSARATVDELCAQHDARDGATLPSFPSPPDAFALTDSLRTTYTTHTGHPMSSSHPPALPPVETSSVAESSIAAHTPRVPSIRTKARRPQSRDKRRESHPQQLISPRLTSRFPQVTSAMSALSLADNLSIPHDPPVEAPSCGEYAGYSETFIRARDTRKPGATEDTMSEAAKRCTTFNEAVCPIRLPPASELHEWTHFPDVKEGQLRRRVDDVLANTHAALGVETPTAEEIAHRATLIRNGAPAPPRNDAADALGAEMVPLPEVTPFTEPPQKLGNLETSSPGLRPALPQCRACGRTMPGFGSPGSRPDTQEGSGTLELPVRLEKVERDKRKLVGFT